MFKKTSKDFQYKIFMKKELRIITQNIEIATMTPFSPHKFLIFVSSELGENKINRR